MEPKDMQRAIKACRKDRVTSSEAARTYNVVRKNTDRQVPGSSKQGLLDRREEKGFDSWP